MSIQTETKDDMAAAGATEKRTMRALVQEGRGSADALHVREIPTPELIEGRVLLKMRAASVNALDWHTTHGGVLLDIVSKLMRSAEQPVRGVDIAGTVIAVAPDVTTFKVGDEVFGGSLATFAEYVRARPAGLLLKPREIPSEQAACIGVAGRTALQGLRDHAGVKAGDNVLVHGAGGGVGTFAVQIAKALGATVTAVTGPKNVDVVSSLGADEVIDYSKQDVTKRRGQYDAVLDIAGTRSVTSLRRTLKPGGVFVQVGATKGSWAGVFARIGSVFFRSRVLKQRVKFYVAKSDLKDLEYLRDLMLAGKIRAVIDRTYPLSEAREAIRYLGTGQARAKVVVVAD